MNAPAHLAAAFADPDQPEDRAALARWIACVPMEDPASAHAEFGQVLAQFNQSHVAGPERLAMLELLREPVMRTQDCIAPVYCGTPLPYPDVIASAWSATVDLWQHLATGYQICTRGWLERERGMETHGVVSLARACEAIVATMFEYARAYRGVDPGLWKRLNRLYAIAESKGVADAGSPDAASCADIYARAALLHVAQPGSLPPRTLEALWRLLARVASACSMHPAVPAPAFIPLLAVNLAGNGAPGLSRNVPAGPSTAYLDTRRLAQTLRAISASLRGGANPDDAGFGPDIGRREARRLATHLYVQWCSAGSGRGDPRRAAGRRTLVSLSIPAMHEHLWRNAAGGRANALVAEDGSGAGQDWDIVNESASGVLGLCRQPDTGTAIVHDQLFAAGSPCGQGIEIATVERLRIEMNGSMSVGMRRLPGPPVAVSVRYVTDADPPAPFQPAILLPAEPKKGIPETLLLEPGWFSDGVSLDLHRDGDARIVFESLFASGPNYERVTFRTVVD
jgi:hypothetical protein